MGLFEQGTLNLIPLLVDKHQLRAEVSLLTSEVSNAIDPAQYTETMHPFVEIPNHQMVLFGRPLESWPLSDWLVVIDQVDHSALLKFSWLYLSDFVVLIPYHLNDPPLMALLCNWSRCFRHLL